MLNYTLVDNKLTAEESNMHARPVNVPRHTQQDLFNEMLNIGAGLTMSDISSVWEALKKVVSTWVAAGDGFDTELFNGNPSIQGVFPSSSDTVESVGAQPRYNVNSGVAIRRASKEIKTKKVAYTAIGTLIERVRDISSKTINDKITSGGQLVISGRHIAATGDDARVGYYLIDESDAETRIAPDTFALNKPSEVIFVVPHLVTGEKYRLKVLTQYSGGGKLHTIPTSHIFEREFTAVATPSAGD
ncbi:hypothetical protein FACS1894172_00140 [Spirochaetia bacterium]|nr:hypothetical protein FACS1894164_06520 [Spirochaetia bacterium]GHU29307.1 hypothetical protein FACS1894172_00140 [Spirochaetia bacterium]